MRIAVICGGPSAERGISLNSARSVMDHLTPLGLEIAAYFCDIKKNFYRLSPYQLYSNTPSDFDFKLSEAGDLLSLDALIEDLKAVDLVFPAIHGAFGEDGELQAFLEENDIPFVGSPSSACRLMFDKAHANAHLSRHGFVTLPHLLILEQDDKKNVRECVATFFRDQEGAKVVVKPTAGGSSLGVSTAGSVDEVLEKTVLIFAQQPDHRAMVEPFCEGQEFTVLVMENDKGDPVALIPTEIELTGDDSIFGFRHKYLPTCHVAYHCPPRFSDLTIEGIREAAEALFRFFGMRDFARLDGWLLADGRVIFSDFNPISGMEQNSHLFIQGSRIGLTHGDMLQYIVGSAARRYGLSFSQKIADVQKARQKVDVLFGGVTAERQVSLMSGTNVWLKLRQLAEFDVQPYLLAQDDRVWSLPYTYTLNHTCEEIVFHCSHAGEIGKRLSKLVPPIREKLHLSQIKNNPLPEALNLEQFCLKARSESSFVFLALHGGSGEDGTMQALLEKYDVAYNGSGPLSSKLCMDKDATGEKINGLHEATLTSTAKIAFSLASPPSWHEATEILASKSLIIKPQADGCSAGVMRLRSDADYRVFLQALKEQQLVLGPDSIEDLTAIIELPSRVDKLLLEPFIETDAILVRANRLVYQRKTGWVELTVGILEEAGKYHALSPSITIAESAVLSLEEKFQGGTGINLTPPPAGIVRSDQILLIKDKVELAAKTLGIAGYARIDIFFNTETNATIIIEANTLPGLTASTVIFHQALQEDPPLTPSAFLSLLVKEGIKRQSTHEKRRSVVGAR